MKLQAMPLPSRPFLNRSDRDGELIDWLIDQVGGVCVRLGGGGLSRLAKY